MRCSARRLPPKQPLRYRAVSGDALLFILDNSMPKWSRREFVAGLSALPYAVKGVAQQQPAARDLVLWYQEPADKWTDALPIGNGRLGAMVFGGILSERLQLNEDTLWSGAPREWNNGEAKQY